MDIRERMTVIEAFAKEDKIYVKMLKDLRMLEPSWDDVLGAVPEVQRDILCDYLTLCEAMSCRKLEIACAYMHFRA